MQSSLKNSQFLTVSRPQARNRLLSNSHAVKERSDIASPSPVISGMSLYYVPYRSWSATAVVYDTISKFEVLITRLEVYK
jgi:hypothetical protein